MYEATLQESRNTEAVLAPSRAAIFSLQSMLCAVEQLLSNRHSCL